MCTNVYFEVMFLYTYFSRSSAVVKVICIISQVACLFFFFEGVYFYTIHSCAVSAETVMYIKPQ